MQIEPKASEFDGVPSSNGVWRIKKIVDTSDDSIRINCINTVNPSLTHQLHIFFTEFSNCTLHVLWINNESFFVYFTTPRKSSQLLKCCLNCRLFGLFSYSDMIEMEDMLFDQIYYSHQAGGIGSLVMVYQDTQVEYPNIWDIWDHLTDKLTQYIIPDLARMAMEMLEWNMNKIK